MTDDRETARLLGLPAYQGAACNKGHTGKRYTSNGACTECDRLQHRAGNMTAAARARERARKKEARRVWRKANPDKKAAEDRTRRQRASQRPEALAAKAIREFEQLAASWARDAARCEAALIRQEWLDGWRERQLAAWRDKQRTRRATMRGAVNQVTTHQLRALFALQQGRCAYCGDPADHLDHKTPISRGGLHEAPNLHWLCAFHNISKNAKTDAQYRALMGIPAHTPWDVSTALYRVALLD